MWNMGVKNRLERKPKRIKEETKTIKETERFEVNFLDNKAARTPAIAPMMSPNPTSIQLIQRPESGIIGVLEYRSTGKKIEREIYS
jgi:hypothetical protein